jgi:hypothetical protein
MEIKLLNKSDIPSLICLYKSAFGKNSSEEFWNWKHFDSPFGTSISLGGYINNQLVGSISFSRTNFRLNDKILKAYQATDIMIDADFKGKGLGRKMIKAQNDFLKTQSDIAFTYYFPLHWTTKIYTDFECQFVSKVNLFLKSKVQLKLNKVFRSNIAFNVANSSPAFNWNDLLKVFKPKQFHLDYSQDFFRWKLSNPKYSYKIIWLTSPDTFGVGIININTTGVTQIVDLLFNDHRGRTKLIRAIEQYALQENLKGIIAMTVLGNSLSKELLKRGFIVNPFKKGPYSSNLDFLVYAENQEYLKLFSKNNWSLNPVIYDDV